jgi:glutamate N-acetyltransferase / amino-acid N-acetyltransferase
VGVEAAISGVNGFRVAGVHAGMKKDGHLDMAMVVSDRPCTAAGVFTTNLMKAAPVQFDVQQLQGNNTHIRAVTINTKCANACTGEQGLQNAGAMAQATAAAVGCGADEVLVMSTGVIGAQLNMDKIQHGIHLAGQALGNDWQAAALGIMTTDTWPKLASIQVQAADGKSYTIAGIAKGAGMIAPNMATMLSVIVTDAVIDPTVLQDALQAANARSFNRVVVDGDMSTNDTVLLLANGASGVQVDPASFGEALTEVCIKLAQDVVRDGEGVNKFITLTVTGTQTAEEAHLIANTIATSPLVKTAFFGGDANWGRIMAAAGRAGVALDPMACKLWIMPGETDGLAADALLLFEHEMPTAYSEARATDIFRAKSVSIRLQCGTGAGEATVWTCDLSHDYVSINGDYRS